MTRTCEQVFNLLQGKTDEDRLTMHAVAQILGVSYPTIQRFRKKGWLLAIQFGNRFEVTVEEVKRFVREGNYSSTSDSPQSTNEITKGKDGSISLALCTPEYLASLGSESFKDSKPKSEVLIIRTTLEES